MLSCLWARAPPSKLLWACDQPSDAAALLRSIGLHRLADTAESCRLSGNTLARLLDNIPAQRFQGDSPRDAAGSVFNMAPLTEVGEPVEELLVNGVPGEREKHEPAAERSVEPTGAPDVQSQLQDTLTTTLEPQAAMSSGKHGSSTLTNGAFRSWSSDQEAQPLSQGTLHCAAGPQQKAQTGNFETKQRNRIKLSQFSASTSTFKSQHHRKTVTLASASLGLAQSIPDAMASHRSTHEATTKPDWQQKVFGKDADSMRPAANIAREKYPTELVSNRAQSKPTEQQDSPAGHACTSEGLPGNHSGHASQLHPIQISSCTPPANAGSVGNPRNHLQVKVIACDVKEQAGKVSVSEATRELIAALDNIDTGKLATDAPETFALRSASYGKLPVPAQSTALSTNSAQESFHKNRARWPLLSVSDDDADVNARLDILDELSAEGEALLGQRNSAKVCSSPSTSQPSVATPQPVSPLPASTLSLAGTKPPSPFIQSHVTPTNPTPAPVCRTSAGGDGVRAVAYPLSSGHGLSLHAAASCVATWNPSVLRSDFDVIRDLSEHVSAGANHDHQPQGRSAKSHAVNIDLGKKLDLFQGGDIGKTLRGGNAAGDASVPSTASITPVSMGQESRLLDAGDSEKEAVRTQGLRESRSTLVDDFSNPDFAASESPVNGAAKYAYTNIISRLSDGALASSSLGKERDVCVAAGDQERTIYPAPNGDLGTRAYDFHSSQPIRPGCGFNSPLNPSFRDYRLDLYKARASQTTPRAMITKSLQSRARAFQAIPTVPKLWQFGHTPRNHSADTNGGANQTTSVDTGSDSDNISAEFSSTDDEASYA